jgi:signal transduction histidine kinase
MCCLLPIFLRPLLRSCLLALLLLVGGRAARAQGPPVPLARQCVLRDSLGYLLARDTRPDTLRVVRLNTLAFVLRTNEAAQALASARQALALARRLHFERGLLEAQFNLGYYHRSHNNYDSALRYTRQALALGTRLGNRYTLTRLYYNLARIYLEQGDLAAALGPSLDGLALARTMRSPRVLLFQLVLAARIELALGEAAAARAYVAEARPLATAAHDLISVGYLYSVLADLSRQQRHWQLARRYYQQAEASYAVVYNAEGLLPTQLSVAEMTERIGDYPAARTAATGLLRRAQATGTPEQVAQAALLLARAWLPARPDSAYRYAALSLAAARPRHLRPLARDAAQVLAQASDQIGRSRAAYQYQVLASAYADSLGGEDTRRRLAAVQARATRSRTQVQLELAQKQARLAAQAEELTRLRSRQQLVGAAGAATLLLVLAGGSFWQYRRRQQARQAQAAAALRQRLAADLHDDVGNLLTQVSLQSSVLRELVPAAAPLHARLDALASTARHAVQQMSDVVLNLHDEVHTLPQLLIRLRDHAAQALPAGMEVAFAVPAAPAATLLPAEVLHHLYLIYKEALHNAVKHAHATQLSVVLATTSAALTLTVADNGRGHDGPPRPGGQGLRNMQARAQAVGGTVRYETGPTGFAVVAVLPL